MRYLFIFLFALGNTLLVGQYSLSFFLFTLTVFSILFFPYVLYIKNYKNLTIVVASVVVLSFISFYCVSWVAYKENTVDKKTSFIGLIEKSFKQKIKAIKNRSDAYKSIEKSLTVPPKSSLWKTPLTWYKQRITSYYKATLKIFQYKLFVLFVCVILGMTFMVFIVSSKIPALSMAYSFFLYLFFPLLFGFLRLIFLQESLKYYLASSIILAVVILLGYLKVNRFKV